MLPGLIFIEEGEMRRLLRGLFVFLAFFPLLLGIELRWRPVGPVGGDKSALNITSSGLLLLSLPDAGGIWYSRDLRRWHLAEVRDAEGRMVPDCGLWSIAEGGGWIYGGGSCGIIKSRDGKRWTKVEVGQPALDSYPFKETVISVVLLPGGRFAFSTYKSRDPHITHKVKEGFYIFNLKDRSLRFIYPPSAFSGKGVINYLDFDPNFEGKPVIALSTHRRLFLYNLRTGAWKQLHLPAFRLRAGEGLEERPTVVKFDRKRDILYVGTDLGRLFRWKDGGWSSCAPGRFLRLPVSAPVYSIVIDPYNRDVIYFGEGDKNAGPYRSRGRRRARDIHGAVYWREGARPVPVFLQKGGWGSGIAVLKEGYVETEPILPERPPRAERPRRKRPARRRPLAFLHRFKIKRAAKVIFTWTAPKQVILTEDGGRSWRVVNKGINGETINDLSLFRWKGKLCLVATAVTANALTCRKDLRWEVLFHSGIRDAGYTRVVLPVKPGWKIKLSDGRPADLLIATGIPYPKGMKGNGLYAFAYEGLFTGKKMTEDIYSFRGEIFTRLTREPIYTSFIHRNYIFNLIEGDALQAYDPVKLRVIPLKGNISGFETGLKAVPVRLADGRELFIMSVSVGQLGISDFSMMLKRGKVYAGVVFNRKGRLIKKPSWKFLFSSAQPVAGLVKLSDPVGEKPGLVLGADGQANLYVIKIYGDSRVEYRKLEPSFRLGPYSRRPHLVYDMVTAKKKLLLATYAAGVLAADIEKVLKEGKLVWEDVNANLPTRAIRALKVLPDGRVVAATSARSCWVAELR